MVFSQQRLFREEADIFALNKDGDLYIFELKRWGSNEEHILQVLRYGQKFGQYKYEQLEEMLSKYTKNSDINLVEKHYEYFRENYGKKLMPSEFNRNQHFVVITNGVDRQTLNAIRYWNEKGL